MTRKRPASTLPASCTTGKVRRWRLTDRRAVGRVVVQRHADDRQPGLVAVQRLQRRQRALAGAAVVGEEIDDQHASRHRRGVEGAALQRRPPEGRHGLAQHPAGRRRRRRRGRSRRAPGEQDGHEEGRGETRRASHPIMLRRSAGLWLYLGLRPHRLLRLHALDAREHLHVDPLDLAVEPERPPVEVVGRHR